MVRTRSQTHPGIESWTLIGTLKEVRIPARSQSIGSPHKVTKLASKSPCYKRTPKKLQWKLQVSHPEHATQAPTPPETPTQASFIPNISNAPSQLSALEKVFDTVRHCLRLYAPPECLPILHTLRSIIYDYVTNYRVSGWLYTRPYVRFDRDVVSRVLSEVQRTAHGMAYWDEHVTVFDQAARWAIVAFEKGTLNVEDWKGVEVSEVYLGMLEFVRWIEQEC
jgi:hypothetical protein